MKYITTLQASKLWNISTRRITVLAKSGKIRGAIQMGTMWMIPADATKPIDGRTKVAKCAEEPVFFRFPNFHAKNESTFTPPLTPEELTIKNTIEAFLGGDFKLAKKTLGELHKKTDNIYIRIAALNASCLIAIMLNNTAEFMESYSGLSACFLSDFPYKEEMSSFLHELDATLGMGSYYYNNFIVKENYKYHPSFLAHLAVLPALSLFYSDAKTMGANSLNAIEINSLFVDEMNEPADSQTIHLYLGFAYHTLGMDDAAELHYRKALAIAEEYNLYWLPALQYYYYQSAFKGALCHFPHAFATRLRKLSTDVHNRYTTFWESDSRRHIFALIPKNKYLYAYYAAIGCSNKEVATRLGISENSVGKAYTQIYSTLGISTKKELVNLYLKSLEN